MGVTILVVGAICFICTTKRMILAAFSLSPLYLRKVPGECSESKHHMIKTSQDENITRLMYRNI